MSGFDLIIAIMFVAVMATPPFDIFLPFPNNHTSTKARIIMFLFTAVYAYLRWLSETNPAINWDGASPLMIFTFVVAVFGVVILLYYFLWLVPSGLKRASENTYMYKRPSLSRFQRVIVTTFCIISVGCILWYFFETYIAKFIFI
jgi:hypothetical protein